MSDDLYLLSIALLTFAIAAWVMWKYPPPEPPEKKEMLPTVGPEAKITIVYTPDHVIEAAARYMKEQQAKKDKP